MADGWARTTGRVGVASVHQGPGLTNTLTALGRGGEGAHAARGAGRRHAGGRAALELPHRPARPRARGRRACRSCCTPPETAAADAARALRRAQLERRPVVLMMPIDRQAAAAPVATGGRAGAAARRAGAGRRGRSRAPPTCSRRRAAGDHRRARRRAWPVRAAADRGARRADRRAAGDVGDGPRAVRRAALRARHRGRVRLAARGRAAGRAPTSSSSLGATLNHWTTRHGALLGAGARLVQVDVDAAAIGAHQPADVGVVGDAAAARAALHAELARARASRRGPADARRSPQAIAARRWRDEPYEDAPAARHDRPAHARHRARRRCCRPTARSPSTPARSRAGRRCTSTSPTRARGCSATPFSPSASGSAPRSARPSRARTASRSPRSATAGCSSRCPSSTPPPASACRSSSSCGTTPPTAPRSTTSGRWARTSASRRFPDADIAAIARGAGVPAHTVRAADDLAPVAAWAADPAGPLLLDAKVDPGDRRRLARGGVPRRLRPPDATAAPAPPAGRPPPRAPTARARRRDRRFSSIRPRLNIASASPAVRGLLVPPARHGRIGRLLQQPEVEHRDGAAARRPPARRAGAPR